ncbi:MAG: ABC transporter permease [Candidatus Acidiferrales bacterium]
MSNFLQDLRFGLRTLLKAPGFTAIAILTLALGIGANSALFSVVNGVLLNPLPYPKPNQLVSVYTASTEFDRSSSSYMNIVDWDKENKSFAHLGAWRNYDLFLTGAGEGERVRAYMVSVGFFPALGVQPTMGRVFHAEEDRIGGAPVAIISEGLWERKFGSARDIIGKSITLTGTSYEVVGVVPASFALFGRARDVYTLMGQWNDPTFRDRHVSFGTQVVGLLKDGVTMAQAQAEMTNIAKELETAYPDSNKGRGIELVPLKEDMVGNVKPFLLILLGAVGFVLLISCANVANLLLARSTGRAREFAIRAAMGASRGRLIRQLITESVLLAMAGGAAGLAIAYLGGPALIQTLPQALPRSQNIQLDAHVLLFTLGASLLVGVLFGLAPALRLSRENMQLTLKEGGRGASGARHKVQTIFVAVEMALALVLLAGSGLMIRSLSALWSVNPGFNSKGLLTFSVTLPRELAANPQGQRALLRAIHSTLVSLPGVQYASLQGGSLPMQGDSELPFWIEGHPKPATMQDMPFALFYLAEPEYLKAMGTTLLRGRFYTEQDSEHSAPVVVIDEQFAKQYFPNEDPIGKQLNFAILDTQCEIIGVAAHVKHWGLDSDAKNKLQAQIYMPIMQLPDKFMPLLADGIDLVARVQGVPGDSVPAIRNALGKVNSDQVMFGVQTMDEIISDYLAKRRFSMILLSVFAALALLLASVGIYGVISYIVGQRTHEIGVRMALGAQRGDVMRLVLRQGGFMAIAGVGCGVGAALGLTWLLTRMNMLFSVSAHDPVTLAGVSILLTAVALLACYVPARRAMKTDPVVALRYE